MSNLPSYCEPATLTFSPGMSVQSRRGLTSFLRRRREVHGGIGPPRFEPFEDAEQFCGRNRSGIESLMLEAARDPYVEGLLALRSFAWQCKMRHLGSIWDARATT